MKAWRLNGVYDLTRDAAPLCLEELPVPTPGENDLLVKISCCGVCHTELDEIEGRTPPPHYPITPGHQVIGMVISKGEKVSLFKEGDRIGIAWIHSACGQCEYCRSGRENLCNQFLATGRDCDGGYAEYMTVHESFAYAVPGVFTDTQAAPLLCAGAIGYRSLKLAQLTDGQVLGLTGFGASGHLVLKLARYLYPESPVMVYARSSAEQAFAHELGASWTGTTGDEAPLKAHAMIDTTPAWTPVMAAMLQLRPGGRLVINAIRKEAGDAAVLQTVNYQNHLWMEKEIKTVANITRADVSEFLALAAAVPLQPQVELYAFDQANAALVDLKRKQLRGAKVLVCA